MVARIPKIVKLHETFATVFLSEKFQSSILLSNFFFCSITGRKENFF
jgi:hypothetical protein